MENITYTIIRSDRKTISIHITPEGQIQVRCPRRMKQADIQRFVEEKSSWIHSKLATMQKRPPEPKFTPEEVQILAQRARNALPPRVAHYARLMGVTYGRITIRSQHTRWGSCSYKGNLNFNCLLMLTPLEIWDYIIVHELAHRKHMDHSPAFWSEVEKILPNYRQQLLWLQENSHALVARLP